MFVIISPAFLYVCFTCWLYSWNSLLPGRWPLWRECDWDWLDQGGWQLPGRPRYRWKSSLPCHRLLGKDSKVYGLLMCCTHFYFPICIIKLLNCMMNSQYHDRCVVILLHSLFHGFVDIFLFYFSDSCMEDLRQIARKGLWRHAHNLGECPIPSCYNYA